MTDRQTDGQARTITIAGPHNVVGQLILTLHWPATDWPCPRTRLTMGHNVSLAETIQSWTIPSCK